MIHFSASLRFSFPTCPTAVKLLVYNLLVVDVDKYVIYREISENRFISAVIHQIERVNNLENLAVSVVDMWCTQTESFSTDDPIL